MAINTTYKRYNGTSWVEIYFKTSAGQVVVSSSRKFVTSSTKVNNVAFTIDATGDGASVTLSDSDIKYTKSASYTPNYITTGDTIEKALEDLDTNLKLASGNIPEGILTSSNYATTLDPVYAKPASITSAIEALDVSNITGFGAGKTLSALSETDGKISATFQNISITKSQVSDFPTSMPASDVSSWAKATSKPTYNATEIAMSSTDSTTVKSAIDNVVAVANGKTATYVSDWSSTGEKSKLFSNNDYVTLTLNDTHTITLCSNSGLKTFNRPSDFKLGDVILLEDTNYPDRWVYEISEFDEQVTLASLETRKLDISSKADKATTLSGYGITDATIASGVITLGSNKITPLTASSTLDATKLSGTIPASCYTNTTYDDATTSAHGLMTASMVTKLNGIQAGATAVSFTQALTSGTKVGTITINGTGTDIYCQTDTDNDKKTSSTASTGTKLFILGATAQSANGSESKSNVGVYIGTDNCLYSNSNRIPTIYVGSAPASGMVAGDILLEGTF